MFHNLSENLSTRDLQQHTFNKTDLSKNISIHVSDEQLHDQFLSPNKEVTLEFSEDKYQTLHSLSEFCEYLHNTELNAESPTAGKHLSESPYLFPIPIDQKNLADSMIHSISSVVEMNVTHLIIEDCVVTFVDDISVVFADTLSIISENNEEWVLVEVVRDGRRAL